MALVVTHAWPAPFSVPVRVGPPETVNVTFPVGVQVLGGATVTSAQMVTGSPHTDGLGETLTEVADVPWPTVIGAEPLEPATSALPPYVAVTVYDPVVSALVVTHAWPVPSSVPVRVGPPVIANVTVPVGVQVLGGATDTCAQMVIASPQTGAAGVTVTDVVDTPWPTVTDPVPEEPATSPLPP